MVRLVSNTSPTMPSVILNTMRLSNDHCSWLILCDKRCFTLEGLLGRERGTPSIKGAEKRKPKEKSPKETQGSPSWWSYAPANTTNMQNVNVSEWTIYSNTLQ
jgi:hypothetical protein